MQYFCSGESSLDLFFEKTGLISTLNCVDE